MAGDARRAAVLGRPIAHSLSPVLHRAAYAQLGLTWQYDAIEVDEAGLAGFVRGCGPEWAGLSLTMPLKRAVLPLLDRRSAVVDVVGAANTVVFEGAALVGHNTDVVGIIEALREAGAQPGPALVLGGGATAGAALAALRTIGCPSARVLARRPEVVSAELAGIAAAVGLPVEFGLWPAVGERLPDATPAPVVVCAAPAVAGAALVPAVPDNPGVLLDVSYDPWPTLLVAAWRAAGGAATSGEVMLVHQAVGQVELMTGRRPDVEVMRTALQVELARRTGG